MLCAYSNGGAGMKKRNKVRRVGGRSREMGQKKEKKDKKHKKKENIIRKIALLPHSLIHVVILGDANRFPE